MSALDAKLLACCNIAAQITQSAQLEYIGEPAYTRLVEAAQFLEAPVAVVAGELGINAALVGRIAEGVVICYRGTLSPDDSTRTEGQRVLDWIGDFHAEVSPWHGLGNCHSGFVAAVESLAGLIEVEIEKRPGPHSRIYCGHSKGGACAQLAAAGWCKNAGRPALCTTFGAARCGDREFAKAFDTSPISLVRYESSGDVVPHVPLDVEVGEKLAGIFGVKLPVAAYESVGQLAFVESDGRAKQPANWWAIEATKAESLFDIAATFAKRGFAGVRDAHSIGPEGLYWRGVNS